MKNGAKILIKRFKDDDYQEICFDNVIDEFIRFEIDGNHITLDFWIKDGDKDE